MSAVNEKLARLMAMENLRVEHRKVSTAYFDLQNRILVLPIFKKDMPQDVYELLVGHEIGHALETPVEGWHDSLEKGFLEKLPHVGRGFKSFLNVVEDARIERRVKSRYPGLKRQFFTGYTHLFKEDFFGSSTYDDPNDLLLIDRINLHYKVGAHVYLKFSPEEYKFLNRIDNLTTWEEVVAVAVDLYNYCQDELDKKLEDEQINFDDDDLAFSDGLGELDGGEFDEDDFEDIDTNRRISSSSRTPKYDQVESVTDKAFRQKEQSLLDDAAASIYVELPHLDYRDFVISHKHVVKHLTHYCFNPLHDDNKKIYDGLKDKNFYKEFMEKNGKYIAYLVKEFELRKNAAQLAKARQNKTGALDVNKLWSYRFNEEIFKSVTVVPNGKNHGLVMLIDWSGSMENNLAATIEQVMVLVYFCKKVNIPFEVFSFLSYRKDTMPVLSNISLEGLHNKYIVAPSQKGVTHAQFNPGHFVLAQLLSNKMSRVEFAEMSKKLFSIAEGYRYTDSRGYKLLRLQGMPLMGTPLNESIWLTRFIVEEFKKANKLDVINCIVLSDGQGCTVPTNNKGYTSFYLHVNTIYIDPITKKEVVAYFSRNSKRSDTEMTQLKAFTTLCREVTGANYVGFYLVNAIGEIRNFCEDSKQFDSYKLEFRKEKYCALKETGFSEYYVIKGGKNLEIDSDALSVNGNATKTRLYKAFKENQTRKSLNRILLNRFVRLIA